MANRHLKTDADKYQYRGAGQAIMEYLGRNPDSSASDIAMETLIPIATINFELQKFRKGEHGEPRYEMSGYDKGQFGRPAQLWRLAAEPLSSAKRRLKAAIEKVGKIMAEHPQLSGEAVTKIMALAKDVDRRNKKATKK